MAKKGKGDDGQAEMKLAPDMSALAKLTDEQIGEKAHALAEMINRRTAIKVARDADMARYRGQLEDCDDEIAARAQLLLDARAARRQASLEFGGIVPTHTATSALAEVAKIAEGGEAAAEAPATEAVPSLVGPEPEVSPDPFEACTKCAAPVVEVTQPGDSERRFRCSFQPPSDFACDWLGVVRPAVVAEEIERPDVKRHAVTIHGVEVKPIKVIGDDDTEHDAWRAQHPRMPDITARGETPDEAYNALGIAGAGEEPEPAGITGERVTKFTGRRGRAKTRSEVAEAEASATA